MMTSKFSYWLMAQWPLLAAAHNCTYPFAKNETVEWQPGACYRGTWNIISSCITTVVACTWSIQHLNVPGRKDSTFTQVIRKVKWMVITVIFPEFILIHSILQFYLAFEALVLMNDRGRAVKWPWWFRKPPVSWLPFSRKQLRSKDYDQQPQNDDANRWTLTHCLFANMGGFIVARLKKRTDSARMRRRKNPLGISFYMTNENEWKWPGYESTGSFPVSAKQLALIPCDSAPVGLEEIQDKSKQNWLGKLLAAMQILQLILSVITRHIQGAAFSQLEIVTLAFAVCGILIYLSNFYKPQNVDWAVDLTPLVMNQVLNQEGDYTQWGKYTFTRVNNFYKEFAAGSILKFEKHWESLVSVLLNEPPSTKSEVSTETDLRIPNDNIPNFERRNVVHPAMYLLALSSGLFGAMHAIAWNFEFPTAIEKLLWHVATVFSAASPTVGLLVVPFAQFTKPAGDPEIFMSQCLRLLREVRWCSNNDSLIIEAMQSLDHALATREPRKYSDVFPSQMREAFVEALRLLDSPTTVCALDLSKDEIFVLHFRRLYKVLFIGSSKRLTEEAGTNPWPRKSILPKSFSRGVFYVTSVLYCVSRLILLGLSVSSIRKMEGSVYVEVDWTKYLPKFGANGG